MNIASTVNYWIAEIVTIVMFSKNVANESGRTTQIKPKHMTHRIKKTTGIITFGMILSARYPLIGIAKMAIRTHETTVLSYRFFDSSSVMIPSSTKLVNQRTIKTVDIGK